MCVHTNGISVLFKRENSWVFTTAGVSRDENLQPSIAFSVTGTDHKTVSRLLHIIKLHSPRIDLTVAGLNGVHVPETERIT